MAGNVENVSIWWRHHDGFITEYDVEECVLSKQPGVCYILEITGRILLTKIEM